MNRLIKVGTYNQANVYVNIVCVQHIFLAADKTVTVIQLREGEHAFVQETPDHVASAINNA